MQYHSDSQSEYPSGNWKATLKRFLPHDPPVTPTLPHASYHRSPSNNEGPTFDEAFKFKLRAADEICNVCKANGINLIIDPKQSWKGPGVRRLKCGTPQQILERRSGCAFCRTLSYLVSPDQQQEIEVMHEDVTSYRLSVYQSLRYLGDIGIQRKRFWNEPSGNDPIQIPILDYAQLRNWLRTCETEHHHPVPGGFARYQDPIDIRLLDTQDNCLVKASSNFRFLALSYVWGRVPMFQLTAKNRKVLETPGGLEKSKLPQLIQDAMDFVVNMQERYLWVDSLCIEQDQATQKHNQISQMDIIYSQATLTIVALSATNADCALPGVRSGTMLPQWASDVLAGVPLTIKSPRILADIKKTYPFYEIRAWTFQERLLSRRCFFLSYSNCAYNCSDMTQYGIDRKTDRLPEESFNMLPPGVANQSEEFTATTPFTSSGFYEYSALVNLYTQRHLSYLSDALNAFSGILNLFKHSLGGDMVSGLPERIFDTALLWANSFGAPQIRNPHFASWSWAGWVGPKNYLDGPLYPSLGKGIWNLAVPKRIPHPIKPLIGGLQIRYESPARDLQRDYGEMEQSDDTLPTSVFERPSDIRGRDVLYFSAFVTSGDRFTIHRNVGSPSLWLWNAHNICVGVLYDHPGIANTTSDLQLVLLSRTKSTRDEARRPSDEHPPIRRKTEKGLLEDLFDHDVYKPRLWCLFNVLLVQKKGEYWERISIGQVHEDAWNEEEPVKRDVVLG